MESRIIVGLSIGADGKATDRVNITSAGPAEDPAEIILAYADQGADEVLLGGVASSTENLIRVLNRTVSLRIPTAVEFDAAESESVTALVDAGAARVVLQAAALRDPDYVACLARSLGSERIAVKITASSEVDGWRVLESVRGAETEWGAVTWARVLETQGAGAVLVDSAAPSAMPPYDLELLASMKSSVAIPVIAAGAVERVEDVFDALMIGNADGVVVEGLLHSGRATVGQIKSYMTERGFDAGD